MGFAVKFAWRETDTGLADLMKAVGAVREGFHIKTGVLDDGSGADVREGGYTNAQIAALHEFGSEDGLIPERSFVRSTFGENRPVYVEMLRKVLKAFVTGKIALDRGLNLIGLKMASDIKQRVTGGAAIPPPNAASTVARKGSNRTLVDTGRMIASVTWAVVKGLGSTDA